MVTLDDVAVAVGRTTPADGSLEARQWVQWMADAKLLIEARRKAVAPAVELDESAVDYVVREAVAAHVRRPDDATTVNVAVDDASVQRTYRSSSGRVAILDEWWDLLGLGGKSGKAFTIQLVDTSSASHLPWCDVMMGGTSCSCGASIAGRPIYEGGTDAWG